MPTMPEMNFPLLIAIIICTIGPAIGSIAYLMYRSEKMARETMVAKIFSPECYTDEDEY